MLSASRSSSSSRCELGQVPWPGKIEFGERTEAGIERTVGVSGDSLLTCLDEPQEGEFAHALVEAEARPSTRALTNHKGTFDEIRQRVQNNDGRRGSGLADALCRFQAERPGEHTGPSEDGSIVFRQEVVAPRDRGFEGLMARRCGSAAADEQVETVVETLDELIEAQRAKSNGREFDRQRDPVEAPCQLDNGVLVVRRQLESGARLPRALDQQGNGLRLGEAVRRNPALASGTDSGPTRTTASPVTPSGCLLVARIRSPGASRRSASASTADASSRCSQLSRTSSSCFEATYSISRTPANRSIHRGARARS